MMVETYVDLGDPPCGHPLAEHLIAISQTGPDVLTGARFTDNGSLHLTHRPGPQTVLYTDGCVRNTVWDPDSAAMVTTWHQTGTVA